MYVCMHISHTLISVGSLVAHAYGAYKHDVQALCEWTLMEPEQSPWDLARTQ